MNTRAADVRKRALRMALAFSQIVREILNDRDQTFTWLGRQIGVSKSEISMQLSGRYPLTMTTIAKYERALGITWVITARPSASQK